MKQETRPDHTGNDEPEQANGQELLSEQLAERLRNLIVTDELRPGTPLRERTLAEQLQVSRTPLRDALKILAGDGLVQLLPNRGAVVAELTPEQIEEKLDVLGVIEEFAAIRACKLATDAEIGELRALHHEMLAAYERHDRVGYFHLNQRIHRGIVGAARNQTLSDVHSLLNRQLYRYRYQGSVSSEIWHTAIDEHQVIIELLTARDANKLGEYLRRHVHRTWEQLLGAP
ncbi:GntR family transcriptional regulator [Herbaspirillum chlorophenolicum]|uniref:GntR family transcriptional regulator n=1 Tax=Herbaspirillum chlorophenolicum TaxID=211589 RepID=UPI000AA4BC62|nr:GntR family transcriptional regulator [Herbaspirillum chlorophenolicum]